MSYILISLFQIKYDSRPQDSLLLRQRLRASIFLCAKYFSPSGCNQLANLCTLTLHHSTACQAIDNIARYGALYYLKYK